MSGPSIRRFQPGDREAVVALHDAVPIERPGHVPDEPAPDLAEVQQYYLDQGGEFLVAVVADEIVGTAAYGPVSEWRRDHEATALAGAREVRRLRVAPDYRRDGLASRLYEYLEDRAKTDGVELFVADVGVENEPGRRFFEANGFALTDEVTVEIEGNPLLLACYRKPLGD